MIKKIYSNRHLAGKYKETELDKRKKASNKLVSICGKYYTVFTIRGETIEFMGKKSFDKWAKTNEYVTDF
jgi:hypothetical protein